MKKNVVFISIALVVAAIIFGAWARGSMRRAAENPQSKNFFPKPDKILVYKDGKTQTLTEEDKLFLDIFINMNGRVTNPGKLGVAGLALATEDMTALKKNQVVVEFVYYKAQKITVYSQKAEVYGLIFPLTGKYFDMCFLDRHLNNYGGPIASLDNTGEVLGLLK